MSAVQIEAIKPAIGGVVHVAKEDLAVDAHSFLSDADRAPFCEKQRTRNLLISLMVRRRQCT